MTVVVNGYSAIEMILCCTNSANFWHW